MYAWNKNRGTDTFRDTYETIDWNRIIKCGSISKFGVLKKKKEKKTKKEIISLEINRGGTTKFARVFAA